MPLKSSSRLYFMQPGIILLSQGEGQLGTLDGTTVWEVEMSLQLQPFLARHACWFLSHETPATFILALFLTDRIRLSSAAPRSVSPCQIVWLDGILTRRFTFSLIVLPKSGNITITLVIMLTTHYTAKRLPGSLSEVNLIWSLENVSAVHC